MSKNHRPSCWACTRLTKLTPEHNDDTICGLKAMED